MFYISQFVGLIGLILLIISFQKNDKNKLLKFQILSTFFIAIQYIFLKAMSGFYMNVAMCIRNIIFSKQKNIKNKYLILIIIIMLILSLLSYKEPISLLPCVGSILYTIALAKYNLKTIRIVNILSCSLYFIYNIKFLAIAGLLATIIELTTTLIAIYKFDIKKH